MDEQSSVCLNMIVRDEAAVIERCLASVRPHIDTWVIVDTGSLDDTPQRIEKALAGIPGELHRRPWRNFGHNRNEALELARSKAGYLLFIDADEQLGAEAGAAWPPLTLPAYSLETRFHDLRYDRVSLVSTKLPWRWVGVLHEYLDAGQPVPQPRVPGFWIKVTPDGARSQDPRKFEKDAAMLEAALQDEPHNARYMFYLAQSYRDCGRLADAQDRYRRRVGMGGWDEEVWFAQYQVAHLGEFLRDPPEQVMANYLRAYQLRPTRRESLTALAAFLRGRNEWHLAFMFARTACDIPLPADRLFIDDAVYRWRALDEFALAAFYTDKKQLAGEVWRRLLETQDLPPAERERIGQNLSFVPPQA